MLVVGVGPQEQVSGLLSSWRLVIIVDPKRHTPQELFTLFFKASCHGYKSRISIRERKIILVPRLNIIINVRMKSEQW